MKIYNICIKIFVLFFIFYSGECKDNSRIPFKRSVIYYSCKHRDTRRIRRFHNPYAVIAKDMMRRYVYVINIVVIYILLYCI